MELSVKNDRLSLTVSDFGAEMTSLKLDGFEYLWAADPAYFGRVSPILFPITGRFMDGYYTHGGKQYSLKLNGLAQDARFGLSKPSESEIVCTLTANEETLSVYPFDFELTVRYALDGQFVRITFEVTNRSGEVMPYSVGNHTAYRWPLISGEDPDSYFLRFEQEEHLRSFNPFGWTADFLCGERIRPIYHGFYEKGTRSFRDALSKWIEYTGATCDYVVRTWRAELPFVANWASAKPEAELVCIEPTLSISSHGPTMFDREGIRSLAPGVTEVTSYSLELYKKSERG